MIQSDVARSVPQPQFFTRTIENNQAAACYSLQCRFFILGILAMCVVRLIFHNTNFPAEIFLGYSTMIGCKEEPDTIKQCVPFYAFMEERMKSGIGRHCVTNTTLSLIGAYAYSDYSVVTIDADGWFGKKVYCRYFDQNWKELESPVESVVFPEYIVHCCRHLQARFMSVSEAKSETAKETVSVLDRTTNKPKYTLTFCLAPIYGNESKWLLIAELIEHYKLQGVQHFYIYIKDIDMYSLQLIEDYVKSGEVETIFLREEQDREGPQWQLVGVRECLQRCRHHSQYSIFADLDERMMVLGKATLIDYIKSTVNAASNIGLILVTARIVIVSKKPPLTYEGRRTLQDHLPTLIFHNTSGIPSLGFAKKYVADNTRVFVAGIHTSESLFPGYSQFRAPQNEVLVMHYRDISAGVFRTVALPLLTKFGPFQMMEYPRQLMDRLYRNVEKRLNLVYRSDLTRKRNAVDGSGSS